MIRGSLATGSGRILSSRFHYVPVEDGSCCRKTPTTSTRIQLQETRRNIMELVHSGDIPTTSSWM
jgi:hypothetical protein